MIKNYLILLITFSLGWLDVANPADPNPNSNLHGLILHTRNFGSATVILLTNYNIEKEYYVR